MDEHNTSKSVTKAEGMWSSRRNTKITTNSQKNESLVNGLTDGDIKTTISGRLEALRLVVYP